jgi:hypothetical protein
VPVAVREAEDVDVMEILLAWLVRRSRAHLRADDVVRVRSGQRRVLRSIGRMLKTVDLSRVMASMEKRTPRVPIPEALVPRNGKWSGPVRFGR